MDATTILYMSTSHSTVLHHDMVLHISCDCVMAHYLFLRLTALTLALSLRREVGKQRIPELPRMTGDICCIVL